MPPGPVSFWMGIASCYGLGRVDVTRSGSVLTIQLWTGTQPGAVGKACPQLVQLYKTTVRLGSPLIRGGAH